MLLPSVLDVNATITAPPIIYASSPLIYFPPEKAFQINVATYIQVGTTAVLIWDVFSNLKGDYKLLVHHKIGVPTFLYFLARITLLAYMLARTVFLTLPVTNCAKMYDAINALSIVYSIATMTLFNIRVCAVYNTHRLAIIFFGLSWIVVTGITCVFPWTLTAVPIAATGYCIETIIAPLLGPVTIVVMVNDSLVYGAIAYRIYSMFRNSEITKTKDKFSFLVSFGKNLPLISRALLKDSQIYFIVVLFTEPLLLICEYVFKEPPLANMFLVLHLVLVNIFSCRVYRDLKMGLVDDLGLSTRGPFQRTTLAFLREDTTQDPNTDSRFLVSGVGSSELPVTKDDKDSDSTVPV